MNPNSHGNCWSCGATLGALDYFRESRCPACDKATHVCRNCQFYAPGRGNDCNEPVAEAVKDKDRPNFCGYFEPCSPGPASAAAPAADDLLKAAQDLFK